MEDRKFIVTDAEGNEKEMLILFTTKFEEFGKSYIFYHDFNVEGQAQVYVSTFDENGNLGAVETEEEWAKLEEIFKQFTEEQAQNKSCCGGCGGDCEGDCNCEDCHCDDGNCECDGQCCCENKEENN